MHLNQNPNQPDKVNSLWRNMIWLGFAWIVTIASVFAGFAPLALVAIFIIATAIILAGLISNEHLPQEIVCDNRFLWLAVLFAAYIGMSSFWSINSMTALRPAMLILLFSIIFFLPKLVGKLSDLQLHRSARGILVGYLISLCYLLVEYLTDFILLKTVAQYFPDFVNLPVANYKLNRNTVLIVLFLWPTLLIANVWKQKNVSWLFTALIFSALIPILYLTKSETATLAFVLALATFVSSHYVPTLVFKAIRVIWVIAVVMAVPLMILVGISGQQTNLLLPASARHRIIIWNYTANKVPQNPLLGIGIHSDRYDGEGRHMLQVSPTLALNQKGWHPHNMYLQIWYELGAIGATFLLMIGLMLLNHIHRLKPLLQSYAMTTFTTFTSISATGYGMWQSWSLAAYFWAIIFSLVALEYARRSNKETVGIPDDI